MWLEDVIESCSAVLGIAGLVEPTWRGSGATHLRLLLMPSFHGEVCITFSVSDGAESVLVVAAERPRHDPLRPLLQRGRYAENASLPTGASAALIEQFLPARQAYDPEKDRRILDGMAAACVLAQPSGEEILNCHAWNNRLVFRFLGEAISAAWQACVKPEVKNALADAGTYVDVKLPMQELPTEPQRSNIVVLGDNEDHGELLHAIATARPSGA